MQMQGKDKEVYGWTSSCSAHSYKPLEKNKHKTFNKNLIHTYTNGATDHKTHVQIILRILSHRSDHFLDLQKTVCFSLITKSLF